MEGEVTMEYGFNACAKEFKKQTEAAFFIKILSTAIILCCALTMWQMHNTASLDVKNMAAQSYLFCWAGYFLLIATHFAEKKWALLSRVL
jgi:DNA-binding transcriptional regulator of glucitol operon